MGDSPAKKVKRAMSGYGCFVQHFSKQVVRRDDGHKKNLSNIWKLAARRWEGMCESEREPYKLLAEKDKERYDHEIAQLPAGSIMHSRKSKGLKRLATKKRKDPNAPKPATTAFLCFANEERSRVRAAHPPDLKGRDITRELGKMWGRMNVEQREKYHKKAEEDRVRYQLEMARYVANVRNGGNENEVVSKKEDEAFPVKIAPATVGLYFDF